MEKLKTVTAQPVPGKLLRALAEDIAIANGFNCYSKPSLPEYNDIRTDSEAVYYFSKLPVILKVVIKLQEVAHQQ